MFADAIILASVSLSRAATACCCDGFAAVGTGKRARDRLIAARPAVSSRRPAAWRAEANAGSCDVES